MEDFHLFFPLTMNWSSSFLLVFSISILIKLSKLLVLVLLIHKLNNHHILSTPMEDFHLVFSLITNLNRSSSFLLGLFEFKTDQIVHLITKLLVLNRKSMHHIYSVNTNFHSSGFWFLLYIALSFPCTLTHTRTCSIPLQNLCYPCKFHHSFTLSPGSFYLSSVVLLATACLIIAFFEVLLLQEVNPELIRKGYFSKFGFTSIKLFVTVDFFSCVKCFLLCRLSHRSTFREFNHLELEECFLYG